jgi:3-(3-hydroxy-phenyl)propionate hydroxylase
MFDAAIIGCGPVGALAANLLGKAGLKTLVVEREPDPFPLPRAVHLDHEMMRLFQSAGVIDRVLGDMRDTDGHLHVGADYGVIRYMGTVGRPRPFGWSADYFFYQPELEDHLREALGAYPNVDLRLGTEFEGLRQNGDKVTLSLVAGGQAYEVEARYVIGCDGSRSAVRKQLGIRLDDLNFEEPWLVVDAEVDGEVQFPDVTGVPAGANLQKLSVMMCDPRRPATVVPGRGNHRRWEFMLLPGEDDQEMMRPEKVAELVGPYLGGVPHRIVRAATYRFHGLIAETWQDGRVFLAGDAAHQTPPFFGQGMCHGLRDVANLAWKLELLLAGKAGEELLATYQLERDPHVRAVISAAVEAGRYICMLDVDEAAARDAAMRERAKGRNPATAAELIPAIASGVVADGTPGAGERFIQPRIKTDGGDGLLDEVTGGGWRLFVLGDPIDDDEVKAFDARLIEGIGN